MGGPVKNDSRGKNFSLPFVESGWTCAGKRINLIECKHGKEFRGGKKGGGFEGLKKWNIFRVLRRGLKLVNDRVYR